MVYFEHKYNRYLKMFNNRVFANTFHIQNINTMFSALPAQVFSKFIRGITLFANDVKSTDEYPPYHRLDSCGSSTLDFMTKFTVRDSMSKQTIKGIQDAVRTCYIERKLFDKIYTLLVGRQDARHLVELRNMERLYQDYFPDHHLIVDIDMYDDNINPIFFAIYDKYDTNKFYQEETYTKTPDNPDGPVLCTRILYRNLARTSPFEMKNEKKTQSFDAETQWNHARKIRTH